MRIFLTGVAGFIGSHVAQRLLKRGDEVLGVDSLSPYYDVNLKKARLARLQDVPGFRFKQLDVADRSAVRSLFAEWKPQRTLHLAAQAGVRYSLQHPEEYTHCNIDGFLSILEACRHEGTEHLVYASSSSVYGGHRRLPFSEHHSVDHPVSLYAATKKANELMAHCYSHLYRIPTTGLRFFTVYGPWGRPDMAMFLFTDRILRGEPIQLFNFGKHRRDFTYIDDIAEGVIRVIDRPAAPSEKWDASRPDPALSSAPYRIYNIGNHSPVDLTEMLAILERKLDKKAQVELQEMQPGDVEETFADVNDLREDFGFVPQISIQEGVDRFVDWYRDYYRR